ncbi:hypothetical protein HDU93_007326 [Gonapodya sp. JEL0774]|nr:hypothetical protein HDU93_007326 [Gonapodya sp. JEL0774]
MSDRTDPLRFLQHRIMESLSANGSGQILVALSNHAKQDISEQSRQQDLRDVCPILNEMKFALTRKSNTGGIPPRVVIKLFPGGYGDWVRLDDGRPPTTAAAGDSHGELLTIKPFQRLLTFLHDNQDFAELYHRLFINYTHAYTDIYIKFYFQSRPTLEMDINGFAVAIAAAFRWVDHQSFKDSWKLLVEQGRRKDSDFRGVTGGATSLCFTGRLGEMGTWKTFLGTYVEFALRHPPRAPGAPVPAALLVGQCGKGILATDCVTGHAAFQHMCADEELTNSTLASVTMSAWRTVAQEAGIGVATITAVAPACTYQAKYCDVSRCHKWSACSLPAKSTRFPRIDSVLAGFLERHMAFIAWTGCYEFFGVRAVAVQTAQLLCQDGRRGLPDRIADRVMVGMEEFKLGRQWSHTLNSRIANQTRDRFGPLGMTVASHLSRGGFPGNPRTAEGVLALGYLSGYTTICAVLQRAGMRSYALSIGHYFHAICQSLAAHKHSHRVANSIRMDLLPKVDLIDHEKLRVLDAHMQRTPTQRALAYQKSLASVGRRRINPTLAKVGLQALSIDGFVSRLFGGTLEHMPKFARARNRGTEKLVRCWSLVDAARSSEGVSDPCDMSRLTNEELCDVVAEMIGKEHLVPAENEDTPCEGHLWLRGFTPVEIPWCQSLLPEGTFPEAVQALAEAGDHPADVGFCGLTFELRIAAAEKLVSRGFLPHPNDMVKLHPLHKFNFSDSMLQRLGHVLQKYGFRVIRSGGGREALPIKKIFEGVKYGFMERRAEGCTEEEANRKFDAVTSSFATRVKRTLRRFETLTSWKWQMDPRPYTWSSTHIEKAEADRKSYIRVAEPRHQDSMQSGTEDGEYVG